MIYQPCHFVLKPQRFDTLRCWINECRGSASIEFALLIAIVVVCVAGVFWQTSVESSGSFIPVSRALVGKTETDVQTARTSVESRVMPGLTTNLQLSNLIVVSLLCFTVGGWLMERRARVRRPADKLSSAADPMHRKSEPLIECRSRLSEKRLKILNTLINDNHKLLPSDMKVGDLMTTDIKTALPKTTAAELRRLFSENKFRHVLICDAGRQLVGVVSDRDLRHVEDSALAETLMATRPTTVTSDSRVNDAITQLLYGHISSLPVVDEGRLVGIITTTDVVMTLQCTMLAVEQIVANLRAGRNNKEFESLS